MRKALILLFVAASLFTSCARNKTVDPRDRLRAELLRWQNFEAEGVAEISYMGLSLRKMFVAGKTVSDARLDILDGGAFGVNPEPLLSLYVGDYVSLRAPMFPQVEKMFQNKLKLDVSFRALANVDSLLETYSYRVQTDRKLAFTNTELLFDQDYRLEGITDAKSKAKVAITYTSKGDPDKISVIIASGTSVTLLVDKISYGLAEVVPLPKPKENSGVEDYLKFMEELLKDQQGE
jgi:hypothetical protein